MSDLRVAIRRLLQHRAATLAAVVTLASAVGAAGATWSLLDAVLLRPLPLRDSATLAVIGSADRRAAVADALRTAFIYPVYTHVRDSGVFAETAAIWMPGIQLSVGADRQKPPQSVAFVSERFFEVLGVPIPLGPSFRAEDDRRGAAPVAVLSDRYWRMQLDGDPSVIGQTLSINGEAATIVGIAGRGFRGLSLAEAPAVYMPLEVIASMAPTGINYFADPAMRTSPTNGVRIIGRLKPDVTRAQTAARVAALAPPGFRQGDQLVLGNIQAEAVPARARAGMSQFARLLAWTMGLLLVMGCATVGILLLVRTEARTGELAVCLALGASRARLARGLIAEGALLSTMGAIGGIPITVLLFSLLGRFQLPGGVSVELLELTLDWRVVAACAGAAIAATTILASISGMVGMRTDVSAALHARAGATPKVARRRLRGALAVAQVAIAFVFLAATGLFARSLIAALSINDRIDGSRVVTGTVRPDTNVTPVTADAFYDDFSTRLSNVPAIQSFSTSDSGGGMAGGTIMIDGATRSFPSFVAFHWIDADYLRTIGLRVLQGRDFTAADRAGAPQVALVSESFGRMIASGANPIGRRIAMMFGGQLDMEIVGVVDDHVVNVAIDEPLALYMPLAQRSLRPASRTIVARGASADAVRREIASTLHAMEPDIVPPRLTTLDDRLLAQMEPQQFAAFVLGTLGTIALLLTLLGTYVLTETMAALRAREMGIRAALGATRARLAGIIVRDALGLLGVGLLAGAGLASGAATAVRSFLLRVEPMDPITLAAAALLILCLGILVSAQPALRAARVDLGSILKAE